MVTLRTIFAGLTLIDVCRMTGVYLWGLFLTFMTRHWALAVVNSGVTVVLGLALLRLMPRSPIAPASRQSGLRAFLFGDRDLRLRRLLFVAVLCKGAFYLVLGDGHKPSYRHAHPLMYGLQLPNPLEVLRLIPQTPNTIWRPTGVTEQAGLLLGGLALVLLLRRAWQIAALLSYLRTLAGVCGRQAEAAGGSDARLQTALGRAGTALGYPTSARLPYVLLADVPVATPLLVGLARPYILLAPSLAQSLSDAELEAALRHELVHYRRHDHWWRWLLLWVGDVGRLNPFSGWIGERALDVEEYLCDRRAAISGQGAAALGRALTKSQAHSRRLSSVPMDQRLAGAAGASRVIPHLLGTKKRKHQATLERRLQSLLEIARISHNQAVPANAAVPQGAAASPAKRPSRTLPESVRIVLREGWALLIIGLLLSVIYTKFFLVLFLR